ncbi:hypothetical protein KSS87_003568 [Heliosperma pusillum]|nr:hypothetical protein KSS87_003568 [Heliosperma pusillum]
MPNTPSTKGWTGVAARAVVLRNLTFEDHKWQYVSSVYYYFIADGLPEKETQLTGVYDLVAVLTHKGRSADSGHYVAWVKQENGKWVEYDDDNPIPQREEDIVKLSGGGDWHMAYICMYKARTIPNYWILDTGASRHLCTNKELFGESEDVADGECVYMGNSSSSVITGKGKIFLKLTSGKG